MDQWPGLSKMIDVAPSCGGVMLCCKCLHYACGSPWLFLRPVRGGWGKLPPAYDLLIEDRKSTRLNSSHLVISYAVFCLKKKRSTRNDITWKGFCWLRRGRHPR